MTTDELILEKRGRAGLITLHRPKALNALTHAMVRGMRRALEDWARDPAVSRVVVMGAGDKAFCAGGDIRSLMELGQAGRRDEALAFWREEYELNVLIKHYPKPYVALVDGIVMGGGVGVSIHGSHVVAGPKLAFAMPEVGIGFFPDVGGTYFLPRMPGRIGIYLALTGARLRQADALAVGLATHAVGPDVMPALADALGQHGSVDDVLAGFATAPGLAGIAGHRGSIDRCFKFDTVEAILAALDKDAAAGDSWCADQARAIRAKSPTSLKIALAQVRRGKTMGFVEAMRAEMRIVSRVGLSAEFHEGVRAVIVDKDNAPKWSPSRLDAVKTADVEACFAPFDGPDLAIPPLVAAAVTEGNRS